MASSTAPPARVRVSGSPSTSTPSSAAVSGSVRVSVVATAGGVVRIPVIQIR